jgi:glucosamine--fructose-6-phosphate aminotransferase (isomerizing)
MCGIVAYLGKKVAQPILTEGLKRLEYRGYDSAGVALLGSGSIRITKSSGRISALEQILEEPDAAETFGIGHTRWATHGEPNTVNAHPHLDHSGKIALVHNGIIENYATLKTWLRNEGVEFASDTDTENPAKTRGRPRPTDRTNSSGPFKKPFGKCTAPTAWRLPVRTFRACLSEPSSEAP